MTKTRTLPGTEGHRPSPLADFLYYVLDTNDPGGGVRHCLINVDTVDLGRGDRLATERDGRQLRLDFPDPFMSSTHARLERERNHWVAIDAGSRNGVAVNGVRHQRAIVLDGDVVELGRTLLILRRAQPGCDDLSFTRSEAEGELVTLDPQLAAALGDLRQIARTGVSVLITGPSGAGKERAARAVHRWSDRTGRFVAVNCGGLPPNLVEAELFGHRRGAFSGAVDHHSGLVVASSGGTLFLDEVADLPLTAQAALLRALEERSVRAVGSTRDESVDLRVVAATHRDLEAMVAAGHFREDLRARLIGFELLLPALADRRVDIGMILRRPPQRASLSAGAGRALLRHSWPRNIRELVQVVERALALAGGEEITVAHLPDEIANAGMAAPSADDEQRAELVDLLERHAGNISRIAAELGRARSHVQRLLKKHQLDPARYRK